MRKILSLAAAVASVFAVGAAQADVISIDGFNTPDQFVFDTTYQTVGPQVGFTQTVLGGTAPGGRTVTHTLMSQTNNNGAGGVSGARVGNLADPNGTLAMSNNGSINSVVDLKWTLSSTITSAINPASPLAFAFDIVYSDAVAKNISYSLDGVTYISLGSYSTTVDNCVANPSPGCVQAPVPFQVALTPAQATDIKNTQDLYLRFSGNNGWDFTIDSIGFQTPEPTSLALVGLALVGAGVASRRRKA